MEERLVYVPRRTMSLSIVAPLARSVAYSALLGLGCLLALPGCPEDLGVGDPCTPDQEYDVTFSGFDEKEVNVESKSFQCRTRLCLVNHFRGRVSCTYGQDSSGRGPDNKDPGCTVPNDPSRAVTGDTRDTKRGKTVQAQCKDRTADKAVYCSCRCADADGKTDNGKYCQCPSGFACKQLVGSIGAQNEGLTGAYCVKESTEYDPNNACSTTCDPNIPDLNCPTN